jgi:FkbM family methyltransferase
MARQISYAQRYEDLHLLRCFESLSRGFYIDVGAGHPVYDNVSFLFYLRGWNGITVEPNPALARLSAAVRPRDCCIQSLLGAAPGQSDFYLIEDFHGMSTTDERTARAVEAEFGKRAHRTRQPVTTLAAICEHHASATIHFLKIDVEGAEAEVLKGGDWRQFRPQVVVLEAYAPVTLAPAWEESEALLKANDYRYVLCDSLNRYYVAAEHGEHAAALAAEPPAFDDVAKFRDFRPALEDPSHSDHRLATLVAGCDMVGLPLVEPSELVARLTADIPAAELHRIVTAADLAGIHERLFGTAPPPDWIPALALSCNATIQDAYLRIIGSERFRTACGRISASSGW